MRGASVLFVLAVGSTQLLAQQPEERAGDHFRITVHHESESKGENGSSGSSSGGHVYIEQILDVRPNGIERLYDIPREPGEDRLISWQFPVRIFEANDGQIDIVNRSDLERRRDAWLEVAKIPTESCGAWYFTWSAFQVECDPDAILETIRAIKIQPKNLGDGARFFHPAAVQAGRLQRLDENSQKYSVKMAVDEDYFRRAEAQNDVIVGEIMKEPVTFEVAYAKRQAERITGSIEVVLTASETGRVVSRLTRIETTKIEAGGEVEHETSTETIEREPI